MLEFDTPSFGTVMFCIIGATEVGSINLTIKEGDHVTKVRMMLVKVLARQCVSCLAIMELPDRGEVITHNGTDTTAAHCALDGNNSCVNLRLRAFKIQLHQLVHCHVSECIM